MFYKISSNLCNKKLVHKKIFLIGYSASPITSIPIQWQFSIGYSIFNQKNRHVNQWKQTTNMKQKATVRHIKSIKHHPMKKKQKKMNCENCHVSKVSPQDKICIKCILTNAEKILSASTTDNMITDDTSGDSDDEVEEIEERQKKRKRKTGEFKYKAKYNDENEKDDKRETKVENENIITKIKKVLQHGEHERTSEKEASHALNVAEQLLKRYGLTRKDVMEYDGKETVSGEAKVMITHINDLSVRKYYWIRILSKSVANTFNVKYYLSTKHAKYFNVCFYGVIENVKSAALSFEMAFNFCGRKSYEDFEVSTTTHVKKQRHSYLTGLSKRLVDLSIKKETDGLNRQDLILYSTQCERIADDYEKAHLNLATKICAYKYDDMAFKKGYEDGKDIDLKRRKLE